MDSDGRVLLGGAVGGLAAIAVAAALVSVRDHVAGVNVALVLVLVVLVGAMIGGRRAGVVTAVAAAMSFDFFHTKPYNSLKIASSSDIETTLLLLIVGIAVGEIAGRADRVQTSTREQRRALARVHRVAQLAAAGESVDDLISAVCAELIDTLGLAECRFEWAPFTGAYPRLEPTGTVATTVHRYTSEGLELPREGVEIPVSTGGRTAGRFVLIPSPGTGLGLERRLVAVALADQLGVVLARAA
jgi:hypothetical protein